MRKNVSVYLDNVITVLLLAVAGLTPLLFLNQTTEFYEMPKLIFIFIATVLLLGLWIFSWILKGKVSIIRTPLDIPLLILLAIVIISAFFSPSKYTVIYGNLPRVHGSTVAWVSYILLYFVAVSHLRSLLKIRLLLYVLYASGVLVSLITLLSFFGLYLPFDFAKAVNFTPTGSSFSTVAFLLLLLPFPLLSILNTNKYFPVPVATVIAILFGAVVALIGSTPAYVALLLVYALSLFIPNPNKNRQALAGFMIPLVATVAVFVLAYVPLPGGINKIQQLEANFPKEIQLPLDIAWKVSVSAFRDAPFTGTGPSTYLFNFTSYKPLEFNQLPYWNVAFDTATNEYLQALGTIGGLGAAALILITLVILNSSRKNMTLANKAQNLPAEAHNREETPRALKAGFAISALISIVLLAIHASTLVSIVMTLIVLAVFMASQRSIRERVMELSLGLKASTSDNRQFDLMPIIIFILFLVGAIPLLYRAYNVIMADYYHRLALSQANTNGRLTYEYLQRAESMNPEVDLYRVDMAQINFALANALASQKGPTQENPEGTLTDQDRQTIQTLLSQAVNEGRAAVALNPLSSRNWEVLASIYRNISGVAQNALAFSLDAYGRAIQRDPLNPIHRINVGGIYYSVQNYDLSIRFFSDAANLKPDYANAYFNLAIAYREKGDLQNAALLAERTVTLLSENKETEDYKLAVRLFDDLKAKAQNQTQAPAASANSALSNPELEDVEVEDLNNPPSVTPAPSVRPNPTAGLPQTTPTPAQSANTPTPSR